jgi:hypothetical protein
MVSVVCAGSNDNLVCNERDATKTLQYVSTCMLTVLYRPGFTLFWGDRQPLSSYPLVS